MLQCSLWIFQRKKKPKLLFKHRVCASKHQFTDWAVSLFRKENGNRSSTFFEATKALTTLERMMHCKAQLTMTPTYGLSRQQNHKNHVAPSHSFHFPVCSFHFRSNRARQMTKRSNSQLWGLEASTSCWSEPGSSVSPWLFKKFMVRRWCEYQHNSICV